MSNSPQLLDCSLSGSSIHGICQARVQWQATPVLLPRKSHGWRSLVAAVHGVAKSQTRLSDFTFTLHFDALEKEMATHSSVLALRIPGTGKPGWAAVYGVAQSRTRLKRLSSSGSSSTCFPLLPHARTMSGYRSIPSLKSLKNNQGKR